LRNARHFFGAVQSLSVVHICTPGPAGSVFIVPLESYVNAGWLAHAVVSATHVVWYMWLAKKSPGQGTPLTMFCSIVVPAFVQQTFLVPVQSIAPAQPHAMYEAPPSIAQGVVLLAHIVGVVFIGVSQHCCVDGSQ